MLEFPDSKKAEETAMKYLRKIAGDELDGYPILYMMTPLMSAKIPIYLSVGSASIVIFPDRAAIRVPLLASLGKVPRKYSDHDIVLSRPDILIETDGSRVIKDVGKEEIYVSALEHFLDSTLNLDVKSFSDNQYKFVK